jgi:hypothetical protein
VEDQIEIEGPRGVSGRTLSPEALFDREECVEKLAGCKIGVTDRNRVEVQVLILGAFPDRPGLDRFGDCEVRQERGELGGRERDRGVTVAEIRTDRDGNAFQGSLASLGRQLSALSFQP